MAGISVPYSPPSGPVKPTESFRRLAGEDEFYIEYFQEPGRAEREIEQDVRAWLLGFYYCASGDVGPNPPNIALVERGKEYVQAAEILGVNRVRIILTHILPNIRGPIMVIMTVDLAVAILLEATLSFLGVGMPASTVSTATGSLAQPDAISSDTTMPAMVAFSCMGMGGRSLPAGVRSGAPEASADARPSIVLGMPWRRPGGG